MSFRRILIAVDDSPIAARAADVGLDLALSLEADVALIQTVDPALGRGAEAGVTAAELIALAEKEAKRTLASLCGRAPLRTPPHEFVVVGKPAAEIVRAAGEWRADLIVVGSHGRGGLGRTLLGSVGEAVVRHAACPVLVVPAAR